MPQATYAGLDPVMEYLSCHPEAPRELQVARFALPVYSQFLAEYIVAQIVAHERKFYQVSRNQLALPLFFFFTMESL